MPHSILLVAGTALQPERAELYRQAFSRQWNGQASENVQWMGWIEPERISKLYAAVDCAIFPAEEIPLHQAKCSVRLANTLLHGVPVIASAVGEQAAYGSAGAARLVPPQATPEEFAEQVIDVLNNPAEQRQLAQTAQERLLTTYDWARLSLQLDCFYRRTVN